MKAPNELARELISDSDRANSTSGYAEYHQARFEYLTALCHRFAPGTNSSVLDIGRSPLSDLLAVKYPNLTTLGLAFEDDTGAHAKETTIGKDHGHVVFDLNRAQDPNEWPAAGPFDLIVFAEVLEHLYTAPELILLFFASLLSPGKGVLICQTPNAAAIHKRLKLLLGYNPYERIRCFDRNPGHYREYTRAELAEIGRVTGLEPIFHEYVDYFGCKGNSMKALMNILYQHTAAKVPSFRRGQTIVYRRMV